jgi:hypothetical protein
MFALLILVKLLTFNKLSFQNSINTRVLEF